MVLTVDSLNWRGGSLGNWRLQLQSASSVFLSYSRRDRDFAQFCYDTIRALRHDVFMDGRNMIAGERWKERIAIEIWGRDVFLLLWGRRSIGSVWQEWEYRQALEAERSHNRPSVIIVEVPGGVRAPRRPAVLADRHFA